MSQAGKESAVLFYAFHVLYAGQPADILEQFWVTYENNIHAPPRDPDHVSVHWKALDDTLREYYRATGLMVSLYHL